MDYESTEGVLGENSLYNIIEGTQKGRYIDMGRLHLLPLVNVTSSGIRIRMWLERLIALLKDEGKINCPVLCYM